MVHIKIEQQYLMTFTALPKGKEIYFNLSFIILCRLHAGSLDVLDSRTDFLWKITDRDFLDTGYFSPFLCK